MGKLLAVNFAYEKKTSRSRSRSPSISPKIDSELQKELENLLKIKEDYVKKNNEISSENEKLKKEFNELTELKKVLKAELKLYKTQKVIFLPCGHSKLISQQENAFYEEILSHASLHLTSKESENHIIQKQLRAKILEILNTKFVDSFKCKEKTSLIIGKCGHIFITECNLVSSYKRGEKSVECHKIIEKLLPCGHTQPVECSKEFEVVVCKIC